nr:MAG TPA: major capsid protein [Caudoviricetes sp.]
MSNQKHMRYDQNDYDALLASSIPASLAGTRSMNFDDAEAASVFFARELDFVKSQSYDVEYPEFTALSLFPMSSEVDPGAETITYYSYDKVGLAKIISNYATDLPRADVKGKPTTAIIKSIGDSYGYSIQEMRASRMAGKSLDTRKAEAARYQIDYLNNKIAWNGDPETGLKGVLSEDNDVPLYVLANGAKGTTSWADKTEDEILADITGMLKQMATVTKKVEKPDTLALSADAYIEIQNKRIEGTATTVLKYIQDNIPDIKQIVSCPELDADSVETNPYAAASNGKAVALLFKNDARKLSIENPLPFMQYPIQTQGLEVVVPCEARTAGAIIYYPMSLLIAVGI